ncbi:MAG TPA: hypothetical protein VJA47_02340 [archaeon]|nr:hypothetical protein [archaeon]
MRRGIHIKSGGEKFLVAGGRGIFTTPYIPDLVGCAASSLRHYGSVHTDEGMDPLVYSKIVESATNLAISGNYENPLFVGCRQKTGQPTKMVLMEASYGKKNPKTPEIFDDNESFIKRVTEIVVEKGVKMIVNTGIEDHDLPLAEADYKQLVSGLNLQRTREGAAAA